MATRTALMRGTRRGAEIDQRSAASPAQRRALAAQMLAREALVRAKEQQAQEGLLPKKSGRAVRKRRRLKKRDPKIGRAFRGQLWAALSGCLILLLVLVWGLWRNYSLQEVAKQEL